MTAGRARTAVLAGQRLPGRGPARHPLAGRRRDQAAPHHRHLAQPGDGGRLHAAPRRGLGAQRRAGGGDAGAGGGKGAADAAAGGRAALEPVQCLLRVVRGNTASTVSECSCTACALRFLSCCRLVSPLLASLRTGSRIGPHADKSPRKAGAWSWGGGRVRWPRPAASPGRWRAWRPARPPRRLRLSGAPACRRLAAAPAVRAAGPGRRRSPRCPPAALAAHP